MRKLKVGIIGVGMAFEKLHYPEFAKMQDKFEISALCDVNRDKTKHWATKLGIVPEDTFTDWRDMLRARPDIDAFDILVPICLNFEVTEGVARTLAGQKKGIICEKPLASTLKEAEAARDLPKRYGVPIMIAENYRYNDEIRIIKDAVSSGKIGRIFHFIQHRVIDFPGDMTKDKFPAVEWRQHRDFKGGAIADTAVHDIAALQLIFGSIDKVQALGRPLEADGQDWSPYSVVQANLLFESGLTGQFTFFCQGREIQRPLVGLRIFGADGMIFLESRDCGTVNIAYNDGHSEAIGYRAQAGYYNELHNFYNAMNGIEPIAVTPEVEYGDVRAIHMILASVYNDRPISTSDADLFADIGQPVPTTSSSSAERPPLHH